MAAQYKVEALVLGARSWGEADKMMTLFTREHGMVTAVAFGCRRPKSPLAAGMQMFTHAEVQLAEGKRMDTVKQCAILHRYKRLSEDFMAMAYGSFVAEVAREFLPEHAAEPEAFALLLDVFASFEVRNPRIVALAAAWQVLACSGLQLRLGHCVHCGREIAGEAFLHIREGGVLCKDCRLPDAKKLAGEGLGFLRSLLDLDWKHSEGIRVQRESLLMAEQVLLAYLQEMLGRPLKSLAFIRQL